MKGKKNKNGKVNMSANRMIVNETVRPIQHKLSLKGVAVSYGTILSLKPFYDTYASDKEMSLCLGKICLNTKD